MTRSYQYTINDNPSNPVAKVFGAGVYVAVISVEDLDLLRSCRDFVECCRSCDAIVEAMGLVVENEGDDAPVLDFLKGQGRNAQ